MGQDHNLIISIATAAFSLALAVNAFFIKSLVNKINQIDGIERMISTHHAQFTIQIQNLQTQLTGLSTQVGAVADLRARVAVLEFAANKGFTFGKVVPKIPNEGD